MKKYLYWGAFILLSSPLSAQETIQKNTKSSNQIGVSIRYLFGYLNDVNFSDINYTESGLAFGLKLIHQKPSSKNRIQVDLYFSSGKSYTSILEAWTSSYIFGNLEFSWLRKINNPNPKLSFHLGGFYNLNFNYYDYFYQSTYRFTGL